MDTQTKAYYGQFRALTGFKGVPHITAKQALHSAKVLKRWHELEGESVRLRLEYEEESYFDIFGAPDTEKERKAIVKAIEQYGCYYAASEFKTKVCECCGRGGDWEHADGVGMLIYSDPLDPFENDYIIDLMAEAIAAYERQ